MPVAAILPVHCGRDIKTSTDNVASYSFLQSIYPARGCVFEIRSAHLVVPSDGLFRLVLVTPIGTYVVSSPNPHQTFEDVTSSERVGAHLRYRKAEVPDLRTRGTTKDTRRYTPAKRSARRTVLPVQRLGRSVPISSLVSSKTAPLHQRAVDLPR
jgi:hypothetical protein